MGAASRTLTLGDPIFRSLPSLPFNVLLSVSFPSDSLLPPSTRSGPALFFPRVFYWVVQRSYPPPPLPLDPPAACALPHLHLLRYFSLSPQWRECRLRNPRSLRTLRYAAASWRATDATRGRELSGPAIVTLGKPCCISFPAGSITPLTDFHGKRCSTDFSRLENPGSLLTASWAPLWPDYGRAASPYYSLWLFFVV